MESIENLFEIIKGILMMTEKLTAWRFVAVLVTIVLCFLVWRMPDIILALGN